MRAVAVLFALAAVSTAGCPGRGHHDSGVDAAAVDAVLDAANDANIGHGARFELSGPAGVFALFEDGTLALDDPQGLAVLANAHAELLVTDPSGGSRTIVASHCALDSTATPREADAAFGGARTTLAAHCTPEAGLSIGLYFQSHAESTAITARLSIEPTQSDPRLLRASPIAVNGGGGALFLAGPVSDDRILDDGSLALSDFTARLASGDHGSEPLVRGLPLHLRGNIVANTNLGILDLGTGRGFAAGFLTTEHGFTEVALTGGSSSAPMRSDGAQGYTLFAGDVILPANGKRIAAGTTFWSETFYLDAGAPDGHAALEHYADAVRDANGITPWRQRANTLPEGRHVPSSWQSWCLGYTGGYGSDITSAIVRANVDAAARDLAPYGFDVVPSDDGWQVARGDWTPRPDTFPEGLAGEVSYANAHGLASGFWIAPFGLEASSATAMMHPEWLAPLDPTLGPIVVGTGSNVARVLDLSRDDVVAHVRDVTRAMNASHLAWSKQDFAYHVFGTTPSDPDVTTVEAFRRGWAAVRSETPDDTLLVAVAIFGANFGVADAIRTGLDNGGCWDENATDPDNAIAATRAFKTTVRTATRRWYLGDRVVLLDPDAVPFRAMDDPPTIGDTEERTFALFAAMLGGVIELGDPIVSLRPFAQDTFRRVIPAYGRAARPLDVFVRDYNERWVLGVTAWSRDPAAPAPWSVVALTNWGRNRDFTALPPVAMPDAPRHYHVSLAEIGLGSSALVAWDLWRNALVPVTADGLDVDVPAHDSAVVVVRRVTSPVQVLGTDRHVTGGAPDLVAERWDATSRALTVSLRAVAAGAGGRTMTVRVALHADASVAGIPHVDLSGVTAPDLAVTRDGSLVTIAFTPDSSGAADLRVAFP